MSKMSRLYTDIQEMISLNCSEDQVVDFVVQEYGFSISEAQEVIADLIYEEERMILATGYN
jgi:cytochrome c-type biogenesis protein CcmH/NrfF